MSDTYKLIHFDPGKEPFVDRNGNQWISVLFEGFASEPTKWVMRPDSVAKYSVGDTVYGRLEQVEGKNYKRFYKEMKPDYQQGNQASSAKSSYTPKDDHTQESIARSVALKAAVDSFKTSADMANVLKVADTYLAWLQNTSSPEQSITVQNNATPVSYTPVTASGYDKFKQAGQQVRRNVEDDDSLQRYIETTDNEFNDDDLPPEYRG